MEPLSVAISVLQASVDVLDINSVPEDLRDYFKGVRMGYLHCLDFLKSLRYECD